ncbi:MAG: adenylate/guanylate cyclase domain-containing protein [Alphaproteobacteria bacterium]|nr:adenylate/guanylate cyclase domain-containing protein [Alphaproteobacteria bacterium]
MAGAVPLEFEKALKAEIAESEWLRIAVLAAALAAVLAADMVLFAHPPAALSAIVKAPLAWWLPTVVIGPFLAYELAALALLTYRRRMGLGMPVVARFANAIIETSLPTVIIWVINHYAGPDAAFGSWSSLLYFVFIVASTLRLDFVLPMFTGVVAAAGYYGLSATILPLSMSATRPLMSPYFHISKAMVMVLCGVVAGLVAVQLRRKFTRAVEETFARERVTNLFGQHVSPEVVDQLLDQPAEIGGETRQVCVMFLDIRNFTAQARARAPSEVVDFLNDNFAFMIEAVDRHHGIINKFLGDGFMAVFGAPLEDRDAVRNAVLAARDILVEIDRRGLESADWPLRIGIGLHSGPAVTGTIGSPRRKEFTAIGDTVNLASRLEQMNKEFGTHLLVSDAVMTALGSDAPKDATLMSGVTVKGYNEPMRVWKLA